MIGASKRRLFHHVQRIALLAMASPAYY